MVLEEEILPYSQWFPEALRACGEVAFFAVLAALIIGYLIAAFRHGPMAAGDLTYRTLVGAAADLVRMSPRRIWALARLSIQEAIRRRVWVAFIAFAVILMFAGWFLSPDTPAPGPLYITFVMSWTTYLIVLLSLFLSTFSLPTDIKNKTIYTVVTKPVRAGEIVAGRIVGFTLVGTALLIVMGLCSYVFVARALNHSHELRAEDLRNLAGTTGESAPKVGTTRKSQNHDHDVTLDATGNGFTAYKHGHRHRITAEKDEEGKISYSVGPHEDMLVARVPLRGTLKFLDRDGNPSDKNAQVQGRGQHGGVSVGKEWGYRDFLEGGTGMAAIWTFNDIDEDRLFPDVPAEERGLPLEMTVRVFRTHKGDIEKGVTGSIVIRNPHTQLESERIPFTAREFTIDSRFIPRKLNRAKSEEGDKPLDLFKDFVHNGTVEVKLQCEQPGQYYGVAPADVYLRAGNSSYAMNFVKGYLGIWFQMVLVIGIGVLFSTFLSGPVAMVATLGCLIVGVYAGFVGRLERSVIEDNRKIMAGGGPVEAAIRLVTGKPITAPFEESGGMNAVYWVDKVLLRGMKAIANLLPNFGSFSNVDFVSGGFDVPTDLVLQQATRMATYLMAAFLAGFLFLRLREVAK